MRSFSRGQQQQQRPIRVHITQTLVTAAVTGVLCFYAGLTVGTATAHGACGGGGGALYDKADESAIRQRIQRHVTRALQRQAQEHANAVAGNRSLVNNNNVVVAPPPPSQDTDPRFPDAISDIATGLARVPRDAFADFFHLGVPLDASTAHNAEVLLLYQSPGSVPQQDPYTAAAVTGNVAPPPRVESVHEATANCDYLNLIFTDHKPSQRHQCWALMGQYEAFHVQKYMRVANGKLDSTLPLRLVNRGYQASGRKSLKVPTIAQTREYRGILQHYLATLDDVLERLKPVVARAAAAAAGGDADDDNTVIVMVCNAGHAELLLNFLCAARHRHIDDLKRIVIFATDQRTADLIHDGLDDVPVQVFYDETNYGDMPEQAAHRYADKTFMKMMMAKVFCVHMTLQLGYNVIFQDADVVWYKSPLDYFRQETETEQFAYDAYFQDDGNHALFYAPYSANTGFYFLRNNERTRALVDGLLLHGDWILTTKSHQIPLTFLLQEMASLHGLTIKVWNARTTTEFPGGHAFHRRKDYMRQLVATSNNINSNNLKQQQQPYLFHMSWTASSVNKVKFWQQLGEWYVSDACMSGNNKNNAAAGGRKNCCLAEPLFTCHYRDKPSKHPCPDSPSIDKNGRNWWG